MAVLQWLELTIAVLSLLVGVAAFTRSRVHLSTRTEVAILSEKGVQECKEQLESFADLAVRAAEPNDPAASALMANLPSVRQSMERTLRGITLYTREREAIEPTLLWFMAQGNPEDLACLQRALHSRAIPRSCRRQAKETISILRRKLGGK